MVHGQFATPLPSVLFQCALIEHLKTVFVIGVNNIRLQLEFLFFMQLYQDAGEEPLNQNSGVKQLQLVILLLTITVYSETTSGVQMKDSLGKLGTFQMPSSKLSEGGV